MTSNPKIIRELIEEGISNRSLCYEAKQFIIGATRSIENGMNTSSFLEIEQLLRLVLNHFGIKSKVKKCEMTIIAPHYNQREQFHIVMDDILFVETEYNEWISISLGDTLRNKSSVIACYIEPPTIWCSKSSEIYQVGKIEYNMQKSHTEEFSSKQLKREAEEATAEIINELLLDLTTENISHPYIFTKQKCDEHDFQNSLWLKTLSEKNIAL